MRGVCQQRHFPSVARPFRILWAPWAPAVFFFCASFFISIMTSSFVGTSIGSILLPIGIVVGHLAAILVGTKAQYAATIITGVENRRTGSTNLSQDKSSAYEFSNI
jgi:hypothetical protein